MRIAAMVPGFALLLAIGGQGAGAADTPPDVLLEELTTEVLTDLKLFERGRPGAPARIIDLVVPKILPLLDLDRMTQMAMGRNWRIAAPGQKLLLIAEFRTLLVRTYSTALLSFRDHAIVYRKLRMQPEDTQVTVKSDMTQTGRERLSIDYDMERTAAGWKVYDIKLAGVSLVTTYRDSFAEEVRQGGVDGLIRSLSNKNRRGESKLRTPVKSLRDFSLLMYAYVYSAAQRGNQPEPMHALIPSHGKGSGNIDHGPCDITKLSKLSGQDTRCAIVSTL